MITIIRKGAILFTCAVGVVVLAGYVPGLDKPSEKIREMAKESWNKVMDRFSNSPALQKIILSGEEIESSLLKEAQSDETLLVMPTVEPPTVSSKNLKEKKNKVWRTLPDAKTSSPVLTNELGVGALKGELHKPLEALEDFDRNALDALVQESSPTLTGAKRDRILPFTFKKQGE